LEVVVLTETSAPRKASELAILMLITVVPEVVPAIWTGGEGHEVDVDGATQTVPVSCAWTVGEAERAATRKVRTSKSEENGLLDIRYVDK
jgi:hypothetical protein